MDESLQTGVSDTELTAFIQSGNFSPQQFMEAMFVLAGSLPIDSYPVEGVPKREARRNEKIRELVRVAGGFLGTSEQRERLINESFWHGVSTGGFLSGVDKKSVVGDGGVPSVDPSLDYQASLKYSALPRSETGIE